MTVNFIKCRIGDLDPCDDEDKPLVILVHGWTSDQSTWFVGEGPAAVSPVADALTNELVSEDRRHPWAFEYPNIGSIAESGAGLGDAIAYIRSLRTPDEPQVAVVAHSMGGLVTRAYLQGQATNPVDGTPYESYRGDVSHLITLGTPHLGTMAAGQASLFKELFVTCTGVIGSPSETQLSGASTLIGALATTSLPAGVDYFFAAGSDPRGEKAGRARDKIVSAPCPQGSDGTVDVCSARGGDQCSSTHDHGSVMFAGQPALVRNYHLSHSELPKAGAFYTSQTVVESYELRDDVVDFLRVTRPTMISESCETEGAQGKRTPIMCSVEGPGPSAGADADRLGQANRSANVPLQGASVAFREKNTSRPDDAFTVTTGASGLAVVDLLPGDYDVVIDCPGMQTRTESMTVDSTGTSRLWAVDLVDAPSYAGPRDPSVVVNGGVLTVSQAAVTLSLSCLNATEFAVSQSPDFPESTWIPLTPSYPWTLAPTDGQKFVYAKFRDGTLAETPPVSAEVQLSSSSWGSLSVTSSPPGGEVFMDGVATGMLTPATLDNLVTGYHYVSVTMPGFVADRGIAEVEVTDGGTAMESFQLTASLPPPPVDLSTLGTTVYLSGDPFAWTGVIDPESGDDVFYDVVVATDSLQTSPVWQRRGVSGPSTVLGNGLPDSADYFIRIDSIDIQGAMGVAGGSRAFTLDRTPPAVSLFAPVAGDTLAPGAVETIVSDADDWAGVVRFLAVVSVDGGVTFPDTVFDGAWADSIAWIVPAYGLAGSSVMQVLAYDPAGNAGVASTGGTFVIHDGVTSASGLDNNRFALSSPWRNPFDETTQFAFVVPAPTAVRIDVYDVMGRRVANLIDGLVERGQHSTSWSGRTTNGEVVAAGIYFVRMKAEGFTAVRKVAFVR